MDFSKFYGEVLIITYQAVIHILIIYFLSQWWITTRKSIFNMLSIECKEYVLLLYYVYYFYLKFESFFLQLPIRLTKP